MGKVFLLLLILYCAGCMLASPVRAGVAALVALLATAIRWLVVAVIVIALLILLLWMLSRKSVTRLNAKSNRDGGEW
jgi:membrane protein implicated in regulation of membrane protease activity